MTKTTKNPETIALHGGDYRSDSFYQSAQFY